MDSRLGRVSKSEVLARFIFSSNHFAKTQKRVKYAAFMPKRGKTSVFRITNLASEEIWVIGKQVGDISKRRLKARGDILAKDVFDQELEVEPSADWGYLHADITGWPPDKAKTKLIAMKLASKAKLKQV